MTKDHEDVERVEKLPAQSGSQPGPVYDNPNEDEHYSEDDGGRETGDSTERE